MPSGKRWNVQQQFEAAARYTPPVAKRYLVNEPLVRRQTAALANFFSCGTPFLWIAILSAIAFGLYAFFAVRGRPLDELLFQIVFNAAGGLTGWVAVYFLWRIPVSEYELRHLVAVIIAFSGITGNLPYLSTGVREALGRLSKGGGHGT